ncbi:LOW QUALITY PROTEIN: refilin-B [Pholidichthys leucotaenia]
MVGRLNLPNVCKGDLLDMSCGADRGLDSPDSGLPPSPSPSTWLQPASTDKAGGGVSPVLGDEGKAGTAVLALSTDSFPHLQALSFGEGIAFDPLPAKEMRYISSVHNSDRHFIQNVALELLGRGLEHCSETIMAVPHSTWRHYKTQLEFQPCHCPQEFKSTTIIYPKKTSAVFTMKLSYNCHRLSRRFLSSVELEVMGHRKLPQ